MVYAEKYLWSKLPCCTVIESPSLLGICVYCLMNISDLLLFHDVVGIMFAILFSSYQLHLISISFMQYQISKLSI